MYTHFVQNSNLQLCKKYMFELSIKVVVCIHTCTCNFPHNWLSSSSSASPSPERSPIPYIGLSSPLIPPALWVWPDKKNERSPSAPVADVRLGLSRAVILVLMGLWEGVDMGVCTSSGTSGNGEKADGSSILLLREEGKEGHINFRLSHL